MGDTGARDRGRWAWSAVPLLMTSGVMLVLGALERWWPACAQRSSFDSAACIARQDDSYDAAATPPLTGLGDYAEGSGLGWWLLLAALVPVGWLLMRGGLTPRRAWAVGVLVFAALPLISHVMTTPMLLFYTSHDTTPWAEGVSGVLLLVAALVILLPGGREFPDSSPAGHGPARAHSVG